MPLGIADIPAPLLSRLPYMHPYPPLHPSLHPPLHPSLQHLRGVLAIIGAFVLQASDGDAAAIVPPPPQLAPGLKCLSVRADTQARGDALRLR